MLPTLLPDFFRQALSLSSTYTDRNHEEFSMIAETFPTWCFLPFFCAQVCLLIAFPSLSLPTGGRKGFVWDTWILNFIPMFLVDYFLGSLIPFSKTSVCYKSGGFFFNSTDDSLNYSTGLRSIWCGRTVRPTQCIANLFSHIPENCLCRVPFFFWRKESSKTYYRFGCNFLFSQDNSESNLCTALVPPLRTGAAMSINALH